MPFYKNTASQKIAVYAYDTSADGPKTGDAANITAQISKDGGATAATNDVNPTELDATDAPGIYIFDMLQAESNADLIVLSAVSSTSDIKIEPVIIFTGEAMRGTDSAALASVCTEARLAELGAANLPADVNTLLTRIVGTLAAGSHVAQSADNDTKLSTILTRLVGTIAAGTHNAQSGDGYAIVNNGTYGNNAIQVLIDALNDISTADVNTACDTALTDYGPNTVVPDAAGTAPTAAEIFTAVLTTQLTESYAADGTAPTLAQAIILVQQALTEFSNAGTTKTIKKLDGTTTAATETYDDADNPTSITRAT